LIPVVRIYNQASRESGWCDLNECVDYVGNRSEIKIDNVALRVSIGRYNVIERIIEPYLLVDHHLIV
jgi:hypothetical protein